MINIRYNEIIGRGKNMSNTNILITTKIANEITMQPFGTEISELNENGLNTGIKAAVNYFGGNAIGVVPFGPQEKVEAYNEAEFQGDKIFQYFTEEELQRAIYVVSNSDGVVLPGGLETRPYELLIARLAYEMKKPILAMCAGQNALVRALGGSTMQLPPEEAKKHNNEKVHKAHGAYAVSGTDYEKMVGAGTFEVNSIHSYVIKDPGPLEVLGYDDDGHIEVVGKQNLSDHFVLASRFHPETLFRMIESQKNNGVSESAIQETIEGDHTSYVMFAEFVKACAKNKELSSSSTDFNDTQFSSMVYPDSSNCFDPFTEDKKAK